MDGEGYLEFRFRDEEREREIRTALGRNIRESTVSLRKDEKWTTLGTPLRVNVSGDADGIEDLGDKAIEEHHTGRHESIVAAARIG
jgi:hypothetical protein